MSSNTKLIYNQATSVVQVLRKILNSPYKDKFLVKLKCNYNMSYQGYLIDRGPAGQIKLKPQFCGAIQGPIWSEREDVTQTASGFDADEIWITPSDIKSIEVTIPNGVEY